MESAPLILSEAFLHILDNISELPLHTLMLIGFQEGKWGIKYGASNFQNINKKQRDKIITIPYLTDIQPFNIKRRS